MRSLCGHFAIITGLNDNKDLGLGVTTTAASQWRNWAPSPVLVVDDHVYQRAQCSGEFRWIWRQLLSRWAPSLPFDLLASLLPGLQFLLPMVIAFTFLQADVLFHLHQGPVLSGLRLQGERERWVGTSRLKHNIPGGGTYTSYTQTLLPSSLLVFHTSESWGQQHFNLKTSSSEFPLTVGMLRYSTCFQTSICHKDRNLKHFRPSN